jgi:sodium/hydrogen antiporter
LHPAPAVGFLEWMAVIGVVLLTMALSSALIRTLPLTTGIVYLALGVAAGPGGLGWISIDLQGDVTWVERLTEVAVLASLFVGGLRLRLPLRHAAWRAPLRLAGPGMVLTIAGVAALLHYGLGWSPALATLVAAVLAPTDPVLAGEVSVSEAADEDRMRYGLSGEAGFNDGMAFPFVVFGLSWLEHGALGGWVGAWALSRVAWAIPVGLAIGYVLGRLIGALGIWLLRRQAGLHAPSDFLCLAAIALAYTAAEGAHGWGFLSVFAAGVGMRHAERQVVQAHPHPEARDVPSAEHPPAEDLATGHPPEAAMDQPVVAAGTLVGEALIFGDTLERLLEVVLVVLVGVLLVPAFSVAGLAVAGLLLAVIRPAAVGVALLGTSLSRHQQWLLSWFGIRGIGSLYYLSHAMTHGLEGAAATAAADVVVTVVAASILLHGVTGQPLITRYERTLEAIPGPPGPRRGPAEGTATI